MKQEKHIIWNRRKILYETGETYYMKQEKDIIRNRRKILYESGERYYMKQAKYSKEQYITSQFEYITQHYWNIIIKKKKKKKKIRLLSETWYTYICNFNIWLSIIITSLYVCTTANIKTSNNFIFSLQYKMFLNTW